MERKRYLELCQKNAVYGKTALVLYDGNEYYPEKIQIWFDERGSTKNTAVLLDKNKKSVVFSQLERVEEKL